MKWIAFPIIGGLSSITISLVWLWNMYQDFADAMDKWNTVIKLLNGQPPPKPDFGNMFLGQIIGASLLAGIGLFGFWLGTKNAINYHQSNN